MDYFWKCLMEQHVYTGKPNRRGRPSTVDLLVLTSFKALLILKILFTSVTKQVTLNWRSTVLSLSLKLVFPGLYIVSDSRGRH